MPADSRLSLARIDTARLEALWRLLVAMPAKRRVDESDVPSDWLGREELVRALEGVLGQPAWVLAALVEAVLAERGKFGPSAADPAVIEYTIERHYGDTSPELVWSGGLGSPTSRMTRWAIEDLFRDAKTNVLIAGYSYDGARDLFDPLFERATALAADGMPLPSVRVILDCSRIHVERPDTDPSLIAREAKRKFVEICWKRATLPAEILYYVPSTVRERSYRKQGPAYAPNSMHAKCIVVDSSIALVGSANFSSRARDNRDNVEVGALIRDHHFIQSLLAAWRAIADQLAVVPDSQSCSGA